MKINALTFIFLFALCVSSIANAASTFNDRTTFMNAVGGVFEMEGFEAPFPLENPHDFGPFTVTAAGDVDTSSTISQDTFFFTEGAASMYVKNDADLAASGFTAATFSFDSPITAFGVDMRGFGLSDFYKGTLSVSNDGTLGPLAIGDNTGGAFDPNNVIFFGVHDPTGFSEIRFTWTTRGDGISFDNLKYQAGNAVPEPGSVTLGLVGLSGVLLLVLRSRRVRCSNVRLSRSVVNSLVVALAAIGSLIGSAANAESYQWTIAQIQDLEDVTPAFHGGAGQLSTIDSITPIPDGIQLEISFRIGQDEDPLGPNYGLDFARVSLQDCCFGVAGLDLSGFSGSSLKISLSTPLTVQSFLYTDFTENGTTIDDGDAIPGESFSLHFWEHLDAVPAGGPTDLDFDFSSATDFDSDWGPIGPQLVQGTDAVRGWGMQLAKFSGMNVGQPVLATVTITGVVPEPSLLGLSALGLGGLFLKMTLRKSRLGSSA